MSYTPPDQLLKDPLDKAADALQELQAPIQARLNDPSEWKDEHLNELTTLLHDVLDMQIRLRKLAREVR